MRALLEELPYHHGEATLLYRVTKPDGAVFTDELADLTASRGVRVHYLAGPRRRAASWLPAGSGADLTDAEHLKRLVPDVADRDVWLCGPSPWMAAVRAAAGEAGCPPNTCIPRTSPGDPSSRPVRPSPPQSRPENLTCAD